MKKGFLAVLLVGALLLLAACGGGNSKQGSQQPAEEKKEAEVKPVQLSFAGGPSTGSYGKAAAGISTVLREKSNGKIAPTPQATSGGAENITLVSSGEAQMGIVAGPDLHEAYYGEGLWQGKQATGFRIIGGVMPAVANLVVLSDSPIKTVKDLKGKRVSLGSPGSSSVGLAKRLLTSLNIEVDQKFLPGGDAATALKDRQIDAYFWAPSFPAPDVVDLAATNTIRLIDLATPAQEVKFFEKYPYYRPFTIPKGTYKGVDEDVLSIVVGTFWIVNKDLPQDLVYEMTKLAYTNTEALKTAFGPLKSMKVDKSILEGIDVPLHPGAQKFWEEQGITIPDKLKAK